MGAKEIPTASTLHVGLKHRFSRWINVY